MDAPQALIPPPIGNSPSLTSFPRSPSLTRVSNTGRASAAIPPVVFAVSTRGLLNLDDHIESRSTFGPVGNSSVTSRRKGRASAAKIREITEDQWSASSRSPSTPPSSSEFCLGTDILVDHNAEDERRETLCTGEAKAGQNGTWAVVPQTRFSLCSLCHRSICNHAGRPND